MSNSIATAKYLLKQGIRLTPLRPDTKWPKNTDWQNGNGAVTDPKELNGQDYGSLIENGLLAIDIDVKNVDGIENFNKLLDGYELPKTLATRTASGGQHFYFRLPEGSDFRGPIKLDHLGIEVYTEGRQFCSVKEGYEVERNPIAEAPPELLSKLDSLREVEPASTESQKSGRNSSMISKVGVWIGMGLSNELLMGLAKEENAKYDPPLPDTELIGLVRRAARRYPEGSLLQDWYLAKGITEMFEDQLRYCIEQKQFYVRGKTKWERDPTHGLVTGLINEARSVWIAAASKKPDKAKRLINRFLDLGNVTRRKNVIDDLRRQKIIQVSASEMDCVDHIVGCGNGWIDFSTDKLRFHEGCPDSFITKSLNAAYVPSAECPVWDAALKVWFPDGEVQKFVQRLAGYILAGGNEREILIFCKGPAASGKSKFTSGLLHVLGDYGVAIRIETITDRRRGAGGASEDLARLAGVKFAVTDEPAQGMRFNEAIMKTLASREIINARALYQESFDFEVRLVLMIHSNFDLYASAGDSGFWRRMLKVPFITKIPPKDRDPKLLDKLKAESDGILQWAIKGWIEYKKVGLQVPATIRNASRQYRESQGLISEFLEEMCVLDKSKEVKSKEFYSAFKFWCQKHKIHRPIRPRKFDEEMRNRGFSEGVDNKNSRVWIGVEISEDGRGEIDAPY